MPVPFLGGTQEGRPTIKTQLYLNLLLDPVNVSRGQVDFVDNRNDLEVMLHGRIEVGHGLGLDPLCSVNEKKHALAGCKGARNFVGKIHMPRRINQIELKLLTFFACVGKA